MKLDSSSIRALLTPAMVLDYFEVKRRVNAQWSAARREQGVAKGLRA